MSRGGKRAPRGDEPAQQARRAALLRDKMEREKAEGEAAERARKAEGNEEGRRTANAVNASSATSSARPEEQQQTESGANGKRLSAIFSSQSPLIPLVLQVLCNRKPSALVSGQCQDSSPQTRATLQQP